MSSSKENDYKTKFNSGSEIIQSLLENGKSQLSDQFVRWRMWAQWSDVVGPQMAAVCEPVGLRFDTLQIWVKDSVWMHQLNFFKDEILRKIHQRYPASTNIKKIIFTMDRKSVPSEIVAREKLAEHIKGPDHKEMKK